jgi:hypothetical protein
LDAIADDTADANTAIADQTPNKGGREEMFTESQIKTAVVDVVGACNPAIREFLNAEIDNLWCLARMEACQYPMSFLVAQRCAIDVALDRAAFLFDQAKGSSKNTMNSVYAGRNVSDSTSHGQSQAWGCDWSDSSSFREFQRRADAHTRAQNYASSFDRMTSFLDGTDKSTSSAQGSSYGFDKADGVRDNTADSVTSGRSHSESEHNARSGQFTPNPGAESQGPIETIFDGNIDLPPIEIPAFKIFDFGAIGEVKTPVIPKGGIFSIGVGTVLEALGASASEVHPKSNGLGGGTTLPLLGSANCDPDDPLSITVLPDGEAHQSASMTIFIPIIIGSLSFTASNDLSHVVHPAAESDESISWSRQKSDATNEQHSRDESSGKDDAESNSSDQRDVHRYGESHRSGEAHSASVSNSNGQGFSESHDGSDRAAHGEGQSSSNTETVSDYTFRANGHSDDDYESFGIDETRSEVFSSLKAMRSMVQGQIDEAYLAVNAGMMSRVNLKKPKTVCVDPYHYWMGRVVKTGCCAACGSRVCVCGYSKN